MGAIILVESEKGFHYLPNVNENSLTVVLFGLFQSQLTLKDLSTREEICNYCGVLVLAFFP